MKYWDELNELETSLIELDMIKSNLRVVTNGAECSNYKDLNAALEHTTSNFEYKLNEVLNNFQYLFSTIRSDCEDDVGVSTLKTNDYVQPTESLIELDQIVRGWATK